jgi:hypothetical protein
MVMRDADEERVRQEAEHRDRGNSRPLTPLELVKLDQQCSLRRIRNSNLTTAMSSVNNSFVNKWFRPLTQLASPVRAYPIQGHVGWRIVRSIGNAN